MNSQIDEPNKVAARLRKLWFASVAEISNVDLQRRRWLDPANTNPHWSYIEFVCSYPDSGQLSDAQARGWLTPHQFKVLNDLGQTILSHSAPGGDDYNNSAVLADPVWLSVVACAQVAREQLLSTVIDKREREALSAGD